MRGIFVWQAGPMRAPEGAAGGGAEAAAAGGAVLAGGSAAAAGAAPAAAAPVAFAETLPADLRELPVFKDIKDVAALARSYASAAKMVGLDKNRLIALPAEGDAEGWNKAYAALGRPEAPDKYGFTPPEGLTIDPGLQDGFSLKAFELGLSTKQAKDLYAWYNGEAAKAGAGLEQQSAAQVETATAQLKTEWGAAFQQNLDLAKRAVAHYGGADVTAELERGMGNNPALIKMFAKLGKGLSEDGLVGRGADAGGIASPVEAKQQIGAKQADKGFMKAYTTKTDPGHPQAVAEMEKLYKQAYPDS